VVGRDVAVKIILPKFADDPNFIRRFTVEAQMVARLEHPHIVPLYDYWREPGGAFLVMRWLRGGSLQQALQRGPWNLAPAVHLVHQIAGALHVAHRQGIIHRDIKPANILLDGGGNAYLSDFGVATLVGPLSELRQPSPVDIDDSSGSLGYLSPEGIMQGPVTAASDIYSLGVVIYELLTARHPFPGSTGQELLDKHLHGPFPATRHLRPELPPFVDTVIQKATAKDPKQRYTDVLELAAALQSAVSARPGPAPAPTGAAVVQNPYKGLRPFQEADARDFFGRKPLVKRLLSRMGEDGAESRFLALVGPSGSGKSSVISAGLLPTLRHDAIPGSSDWFFAQMVPGRYPLDELEIALLRVAVSQPAGLMEQLRRDERGLLRATSLALPDEGSELLLVIDQFEEIFTLARDDKESARFLKLLSAAINEPRSQVRLIISLRADFYDRPLTHREFGQLMRTRTEVVVPMDAEEMSQAIYEPAARTGVQLEPELLTTIVADVGEQPGALPLLQYALTELFERRDGRQLTLAAYHEMGGVLGALGRRAEEIYKGLDKDQQATTRQLFLRLVTLGERVSNVQATPDTRRRVLRTELERLNAGQTTSQNFNDIIETFGRYRLLTFDRDPITREPTVEVAHEALLREWDRFRLWLDESREDIRQERAVSHAAEEWEQHDRDRSFLLRGARLEQVEEWQANSTLVQTPLAQAYISQSLLQRDDEKRAEAERKAREVQLERRSRLFLRGLLIVFAMATVVSVGLLIVAIGQRQSALESAAEVQNVALVEASQAAFADNDTDTAIALAWQALELKPDSAMAQTQLGEVAYAPGTVSILPGNKDIVNRIVLSHNDKTLLGGVDDGSVILWDTETGRILWQEQVKISTDPPWVQDVAFSPDGRFVAATYDDRIMLWHAADGQLYRQIDSLVNRQKIAFNPLGEQFATIGSEEQSNLVIWDLASGNVVGKYPHGSNVEDIAYTADGSAILIAGRAGDISLVGSQSGQLLYEFQGYTGSSEVALRNIDISPDSSQVIASAVDAGLLVWDFDTGELRHDYIYAGVLAATFNPNDGSVLIGDFPLLRTIDLQTGAILRTNRGHDRGLLNIAVTSDGSRAFTTSLDETVRVWDLNNGQVVRRFTESSAILGEAALSPDGRTVLASSTDGTATLWDVETGTEVHRFVDDQPINTVSFSADGHIALVGTGYENVGKIEPGHIIMWDVDTGAEIQRFTGHPYAVTAVAFSPDGRVVASVGHGALAVLWDVETGTEIHRLEDYWVDSPWGIEAYLDVAFSPDGKQLYASHDDGNIIVWDVKSGQKIRELAGHKTTVMGISFSHDGQLLVSGGLDEQVILWDVETGVIQRSFVQAGVMERPQFSPDDSLLIGGNLNGFTSLLSVETGEVIRRYEGFAEYLSFSSDGSHTVAGFQSGAVELWRIDSGTDDLLTWVRSNRYIPELTCEQRELYRVEPICDPAIE